ncbi:CHAT domain-containing protein [Phyllosticta citribraziliensis]|uniref:CHAT domain-containing protein n=1 Tax=Phyllosticta citribraziliensis TaxID=989973 RepID=A0ABR1LAA8_9PEZI
MEEFEDRAMALLVKITTVDENDHQLQPILYHELEHVRWEQFLLSKDVEYLDEAIAAVREALRTAPSGSLRRRGYSACLAGKVCFKDSLVAIASEESSKGASITSTTTRQRQTQIEESDELFRRVSKPRVVRISACPPKRRPIFQIAVAQWLFQRSIESGCERILDKAASLARTTLESASGEETRESLGIVYQRILTYKYFRYGPMGLYDAITLGYKHAEAVACYGPKFVAALFYDGLENVRHLQERITVVKILDRGNLHQNKYTASGGLAILDLAIKSYETIPDDVSEARLLGLKCQSLAICYSLRHQANACRGDLEKALTMGAMARKLIPNNDPEQSRTLYTLGKSRAMLHFCTSKVEHVDEAIILFEEAVKFEKADPVKRAFYAGGLAGALRLRYTLLDDTKDLEAAGKWVMEAMGPSEGESDNMSILLMVHGTILFDRHRKTGDIDDLNLAIQKISRAKELFPEGHFLFAQACLNFGWPYMWKFRRTGHADDLEKAVESFRQAEKSSQGKTAPDPETSFAFSKGLFIQYQTTKDSETLEESISILQEAISSIPTDYTWTPILMTELGHRFFYRYKSMSNPSDLDVAVSYAEGGLKIFGKTHYHWGLTAQLLSTMLFQRAAILSSHNEAAKSQQLVLEIAKNTAVPPWLRVQAVSTAIHGFRNSNKQFLQRHDELARLALDLLPYACSRELSREDQQEAVKLIEFFAADSCSLAIRLGNFPEALHRVEYGRGLVLGHLIDRQDDLADLKETHPDLAQRYERLRHESTSELEAEKLSKEWEFLMKDKRKAQAKLRQCEDEIRCQPGFEHFQKPPSLEELGQGGLHGPVIIVNVTDFRSDAIILLKGLFTAICLPGMVENMPDYFRQALDRQRSGARLPDTVTGVPELWKHPSERFRLGTSTYFRANRPVERDYGQPNSLELLTWLWHSCVLPVLLELRAHGISREDDGDPPRVWWIGSGAASSLPFHAAGDFGAMYHVEGRRQQASSDFPKTCMDWVTSSYAPTIKALQHARARAEQSPLVDRPSITVVTMPSTPGQSNLKGAQQEKKAVEEAATGFSVEDSLECPTAAEVLGRVPDSQILHFACHGMSDPIDPSASHMLLQKKEPDGRIVPDRLTLGDVLDRTVKSGSQNWLVYLSACSTAQVKADKMGDESLHLASAFQVAGFAHAIGSLWSADDDICVEVARLFYQELSEYTGTKRKVAVAHALRKAVIQIRSRHYDNPALWAPFIHFGA